MKLKYRNKISIYSFLYNLVIITGFFYLILNAYNFSNFSTSKVQAYSTNLTYLTEEVTDWSMINPANIYVDNNSEGVIYYIVQPWDTLSKIALNFWITISHLKKINNIKSNIIKPWQKLTITEQDWFIYISQWETVTQIAKKFSIKPEEILETNSLNTKDYKFEKGDEVFIPMSEKKYKEWLANQKKKSNTNNNTNSNTNNTNNIWRSRQLTNSSISKSKGIVSKYRYHPNIYNGFYRWHCTRYVAIKKFPYMTKNKQKKLWNWNAKYWYQNAKAAGYSVWKTPKIGAIVVIKVGGRRYYYAWHVAIVKKIDWKNKRLLIEEMNAIWKYVVTLRRVPMNSKIIGYIYL